MNIVLKLCLFSLLIGGCLSWSVNIPYSVPHLDTGSAQATLNHIQNTISMITSNLSAISNDFSAEQVYALNQLAMEGVMISTLMAQIRGLNAQYAQTMGQVYTAQDTLNGLQGVVNCFQNVQANCTTTTTSTTTTTTTTTTSTSTSTSTMSMSTMSSSTTVTTPYDYCINNPGTCLNGASCLSLVNNTYHCICNPNFTGVNCSQVVCNAQLPLPASANNQTLASPLGYTNDGSSNVMGANCMYTITAETNHKLDVYINTLLNGADCSSDYISLQAGDPLRTVAIFCAANSSNTFYPQSQLDSPVLLHFVTSNAGGAFSLTYNEAACNPCVLSDGSLYPCNQNNSGVCLVSNCQPSCDCSNASPLTGPHCTTDPCAGHTPCEGFPTFFCTSGQFNSTAPCTFDHVSCTNPHCNCLPNFCGDYCENNC